MFDARKRKHITDNMATSGESMLPADPVECKHLATLFSVQWMVCRHLGLINKTDATMWELSELVREYIDWFKTRAFSLGGLFGQSLDQSNERILKGYVARAVTSCFICTVTSQLEKHNDFRFACLRALQSMESSALTLYWANMALLNGITHLVDAGLCLVNQMIRSKAKSPVLSLDFLISILDANRVPDSRCAEYQELKAFLQSVYAKRDSDGFTGSYLYVEGVGSNADYIQIETYIQKYFGLNHNSWYTVYKAWSECANKVIDFTSFLDMQNSMLDARTLFRRLGIQYDDNYFHAPGGDWNAGHRYLVCVAEQQGADKSFPATVGKVWVHITQHLFINALIGDVHLHSDNTIEMGKNLFALIASTITPQQVFDSVRAGHAKRARQARNQTFFINIYSFFHLLMYSTRMARLARFACSARAPCVSGMPHRCSRERDLPVSQRGSVRGLAPGQVPQGPLSPRPQVCPILAQGSHEGARVRHGSASDGGCSAHARLAACAHRALWQAS